MLATGVQGFCAPKSFLNTRQWETLRGRLDELPVWTLVNDKDAPLGYERDGNQFAIFFADPLHAQEELDTRSAENPQLSLRSMGVGLGDAFARAIRGDAMLIASREALSQAGEDWDSAEVPLYTCLALSVPNAPGVQGRSLPLFLDPVDAQRSLDAALSAATAQGGLSEAQLAQMQLVCTPLSKAVEFVVTGTEKASTGADRFQFVASSRALAFLREQMQPSQDDLQSKLRRANALKQEEANKGLIFPE